MTNEIPEFEIKSMNITLDRYEAFREICRERLSDLTEREIMALFHGWLTVPVGR